MCNRQWLCHVTFVFTYNTLAWLSDRAVMATLDDVVFVSASKALIKLKASASQDKLLDALAAFDSRCPNLVRQSFDNEAIQVFVAPSHCGSLAKKSKHRARKSHMAAPQASGGLSPTWASGAPQARVISLATHLGFETKCDDTEIPIPAAACSSGGGSGVYICANGDFPMCLLSPLGARLQSKRRADDSSNDPEARTGQPKRRSGNR